MRVVIFTDRYPYGQYEETFVANEVKFLASRGNARDVLIVPLKGEASRRDVPTGVEVARPLLQGRGKAAWLLLLVGLMLRGSFWLFALDTLQRMARGVRLPGVWFTRYVSAELVSRCALRVMAGEERGVMYSYWMSYGALGIALARWRANAPAGWRFVCRAHRYDIIEADRGIPLRGFTWRWLEKVFPVSAAGAAELLGQRGAARSKVQVAYLGVQGLARPVPVNPLGSRVLFVSCSGVRPVKRLDMMLRLVEAYAAEEGAQRVDWVHFGDGEQLEELRACGRGAEARRGNLRVEWRGGMDNAAVLREYESLGGAIFLNTSSSEGLPVSIMEALSAGFPVVATNVGGTAEALEGGSGELLDATPGEGDFVGAVNRVRGDYMAYSRRARAAFEARFNAEKNYRQFYEGLLCDVTRGQGE